MEIEIRRSNRRTIALEVTTDRKVIVRAPLILLDGEIKEFIQEKADWIEKSLQKVEQRRVEQSQQEKLLQNDIQELANKALVVIPPKVAHYAQEVGVTYGRITIRNQKSRWGSCSGKGNLNFNCLLMLMPEAVQDYVVVHELCHRKEMNHSSRFWNEVACIMEDYKIHRKWLRENGENIIARIR